VTFSANVNIDYRLPIKVYYRICTVRHIRIEINQTSFHDLFLNYTVERTNVKLDSVLKGALVDITPVLIMKNIIDTSS
jgi:hypothetical protein